MTLKQILERMKALRSEMQEVAGKAKSATDADERKKQEILFGAKKEEFESLEAQAKEIQEFEAMGSKISAFESALEPDTKGKSFTGGKGGKAPDKPAMEDDDTNVSDRPWSKTIFEVEHDDDREEFRKRDIFIRYAKSGHRGMDDNAINALRATDKRLNDNNPDDDLFMKVPKSMAENILSKGSALHARADRRTAKVILSTDSSGGSTDSGAANLVAPDFRPQLLSRAVWYPDLYDLCRVLPAVNGFAEWPKLDQDQGEHGGVAFTWKNTEGEDKAETEPVFTDFQIATAELSGWTELSRRSMRRSALDLEVELTNLYRKAVRKEFSRVILEGTGAGTPMPLPLGLLNVTAAQGINVVTRAVANQVSWIDLTNVEYSLGQAQRANARFVICDNVEKYLKQQIDSDDRPIFTADVHSTIRNMLAGYPYTAHGHTNGGNLDLGDEGDVIFGDFQDYGFAIEEDIMIARSEHAAFKQGRIVFRCTVFAGGKPIYNSSFSRLDNEVT